MMIYPYACPRQCPVLRKRMMISPYARPRQCRDAISSLRAMCGTAIACAYISLRGCYAMCGTETAYGATSLRSYLGDI
eukprot:2666050-Rhodomonas_salina.2